MKTVRIVAVAVFILSVIFWGIRRFHAKQQDTVPPVISSFIDVLSVRTDADEAELKKGLTAEDNADGDVTDSIVIANISRFTEKGVCRIEYLAFDRSNNIAHYERIVRFEDYRSPEIRLTAPLMYVQNKEILLTDRIFAADCLEGDISEKLRFTSVGVSAYDTGVYELHAEARNSYGDTVRETFLLNVIPFEYNRGQITLTEYLIHVPAGEEIFPEEYIKEAADEDGNPLPAETVIITREVDVTKPGTGQFRYEIIDANGNVAAVTFLAVIVTDPANVTGQEG